MLTKPRGPGDHIDQFVLANRNHRIALSAINLSSRNSSSCRSMLCTALSIPSALNRLFRLFRYSSTPSQPAHPNDTLRTGSSRPSGPSPSSINLSGPAKLVTGFLQNDQFSRSRTNAHQNVYLVGMLQILAVNLQFTDR